jgi:hypothetical protein
MRYEDFEAPFASIESAREYLLLLSNAIEESRVDVDELLAVAAERGERRQAALRIVAYNLKKLDFHVTASRRVLNDLRTLRRLLWDERGGKRGAPAGGTGLGANENRVKRQPGSSSAVA